MVLRDNRICVRARRHTKHALRVSIFRVSVSTYKTRTEAPLCGECNSAIAKGCQANAAQTDAATLES